MEKVINTQMVVVTITDLMEAKAISTQTEVAIFTAQTVVRGTFILMAAVIFVELMVAMDISILMAVDTTMALMEVTAIDTLMVAGILTAVMVAQITLAQKQILWTGM